MLKEYFQKKKVRIRAYIAYIHVASKRMSLLQCDKLIHEEDQEISEFILLVQVTEDNFLKKSFSRIFFLTSAISPSKSSVTSTCSSRGITSALA